MNPRRTALVSMSLASLGCSVGAVVTPPTGRIDTLGVTIEAADGSFTLSSGRRFTPPFAVAPALSWSDPCLSGTQEREEDAATAERALEVGAQRITLRHPASARPLHGVLLICQVGKESGPPAREMVITVPDSYVLETSGGRRSNVYELAKVGIPGGVQTSVAWRLWLQEEPF